ncbi:MAG: MerR family transcriptional regulator [bacterium]|nr:MerR family transcriptional regulator [bacterium]
MKYSIGEFSLITQLSIKSLRLYHEKGLLVPAHVDDTSGYRFYDEANFDTARSIKSLRRYDFSLTEIGELLEGCDDEADMIVQLERKLGDIASKIDRYQDISRSIASIIEYEKESVMDNEREFEIEEKELNTVLIAGHRMRGRYQDVGEGLGLVCKTMGRHISGKPMTLYFDCDYKEDDADFEPCVPVRKGKESEGISVRELKGGRCVSLIHKGSYDTLRSSYKRIFGYINEKGFKTVLPTREIYRKGPGMIFKGNPKNYLTEIQVLIEE